VEALVALAAMRRQFFFEKKNQKTFGLWRRLSGEHTRQRAKVFCFFSSEKKIFFLLVPKIAAPSGTT
jgi:hypothetical protein